VAVVRFVVEQAGCPSCASLIREALDAIADVDGIEIDEVADLATVHLQQRSNLSEQTVADVLELASRDSGHAYRVKPGSWVAREVPLG
jgi:frataxin-like iron-binding protein CyaY